MDNEELKRAIASICSEIEATITERKYHVTPVEKGQAILNLSEAIHKLVCSQVILATNKC